MIESLRASRIADLVRVTVAVCFVGAIFAVAADAQPITLMCDPAQTTAKFTLGDTLHTVHGAFKVKRCEVHFDPTSGKLDGEIVFDATSGQSGNDSRDRKMHKEVLESARFPEIAFRPDRILGNTGTDRRLIAASARHVRDSRSRTRDYRSRRSKTRNGTLERFSAFPGSLREVGDEEPERPLPQSRGLR